jgi:hypothetical protein
VEVLAFEVARTFFAGISAAAAAIQVWQRRRDAKAATETFDTTYERTRTSREAADAASELLSIIPEEVIRDLEGRADQCWRSYRNVLGGDYLPDEIDHATDSVQACVCRELRRIVKLNGSVPHRWGDQWRHYNCATHGQGKSTASAHSG